MLIMAKFLFFLDIKGFGLYKFNLIYRNVVKFCKSFSIVKNCKILPEINQISNTFWRLYNYIFRMCYNYFIEYRGCYEKHTD